jgi:phenylalanine-4-hydroxylase
VEEARGRGDLFIEQPYGLYDADNQATWSQLFTRLREPWERHAHPRFLEGLRILGLDERAIPRLTDVNRSLGPRTGFEARPVSGYVPAFVFFDCLRRREFPTTVTIRDGARLAYLPEPDIFHDVAGHVPLHTDPAFAAALVHFGEIAHAAAARATEARDPGERLRRLESNVKALARFFWFTVEFGLVAGEGPRGSDIRAYGSGLLSSAGELVHATTSGEVQREPLRVPWVINQAFEIHHYQPLLFTLPSFEALFEAARELERWLMTGKLDNVAPGEPAVKASDLASFLDDSAR